MKSAEVISMYAEKIGRSEAYVRDVVNAYWRVVLDMTKELSADDDSKKKSIYLVGLGHLGFNERQCSKGRKKGTSI